jgi:hypothetical protein
MGNFPLLQILSKQEYSKSGEDVGRRCRLLKFGSECWLSNGIIFVFVMAYRVYTGEAI